jgi:hypothetical protein
MITSTKPVIEMATNGILVIRLLGVSVNYEQDWNALITKAAPDTPDDYLIRTLASTYPPPRRGIYPTNLSLLGFTEKWKLQQAQEYAELANLPAAGPWEMLSVGIGCPDLHTQIGRNQIGIMSLATHQSKTTSYAPYLWIRDKNRCAGARSTETEWDTQSWFAIWEDVFALGLQRAA